MRVPAFALQLHVRHFQSQVLKAGISGHFQPLMLSTAKPKITFSADFSDFSFIKTELFMSAVTSSI